MTQKSKTRKFLRFFFTRLPFALVLGTLLLIGSLKLVEKHPEPIREGFEKFLSQKTNTNTTITRIDDVSFFPNFNIIITDLTMHNRDNAAIIDLEVEKADISIPFWSIFLNGKRMNKVDINNFKASEKIVSPQSIQINEMSIQQKEGPDQYGSFIVAEGKYANRSMFFEAALEKKGKGYKIPKEIPLTFRLGDYALNTTFLRKFSGGHLQKAVFSKGNKSSEATNYALVKSGEYNKDNPLSCMLENKDLSKCDVYLEGRE